MMQIQTATLKHTALDYNVAKALGYTPSKTGKTLVNEAGRVITLRHFNPSSDWEIGGRLLEFYGISVEFKAIANANWIANIDGRHECRGISPLEAAMRCLVTSKLGLFITIRGSA